MFYDDQRVCPNCGETFSGSGSINGIPAATWKLLEHQHGEL